MVRKKSGFVLVFFVAFLLLFLLFLLVLAVSFYKKKDHLGFSLLFLSFLSFFFLNNAINISLVYRECR